MKYCPECGAALKDKAIYCTNCGAKLDPQKVVRKAPEKTVVQAKPKPKQTFTFNDEETTVIRPMSAPKRQEEKVSEPLPIEEKHHSLFGFIIVALFISFIVAGGSAFLIPYITTSHHAAVEKQKQETEAKALDDYILATSSSVELTTDDLAGLSQKQLHYAKNEIYARHGRQFVTDRIAEYFNSKSWYQGTVDPETFDANQDSIFNDVELANIQKIVEWENRKRSEGN